jgi:hypothetical protein
MGAGRSAGRARRRSEKAPTSSLSLKKRGFRPGSLLKFHPTTRHGSSLGPTNSPRVAVADHLPIGLFRRPFERRHLLPEAAASGAVGIYLASELNWSTGRGWPDVLNGHPCHSGLGDVFGDRLKQASQSSNQQYEDILGHVRLQHVKAAALPGPSQTIEISKQSRSKYVKMQRLPRKFRRFPKSYKDQSLLTQGAAHLAQHRYLEDGTTAETASPNQPCQKAN